MSGFVVVLAAAAPAFGQGCIVGRACNLPMTGDEGLLTPNTVDFNLGWRGFEANEHYNGTVLQQQRHVLNNYVINHQNNWDADFEYAMNTRLSLAFDVPIIDSGWSIPMPVSPPIGPRVNQHAQGIGDISIGPKIWLLNAMKHPRHNVQIGVGLKMPTGDDRATAVYPLLNGKDYTSKSVDQSVQPGDGGWGINWSLQAFQKMQPITWFATWNYLINPQDTNGVPSIRANLGLPADPKAPSIQVNSVPDQYLYRVGFLAPVPLPHVQGVTASLAYRVEGVPQKDLIGESHGWRRPGYSTSIEPGIAYSHADTTMTVAVPFTLFRNRLPTISDSIPEAGDSTFANYQIIVGFSRRFRTK